ncbi:MAG: hypothetical protein HYR55_07185 [Acidobacteria bacterium]|nr:hypothetical protein [Acidobacteriota bacterium]MBI3656733.1 hypothetical protein [Acidobacteriota bacterium]
MLYLAVVLCIYLLVFRPFLKHRYPIFYSYLLLSLSFELFLFTCGFEAGINTPPRLIAYQFMAIFQLCLLAKLWREVLQKDYPSLRLLVYIGLIVAVAASLILRAYFVPAYAAASFLSEGVVLSGLAAPSFFATLLLMGTFTWYKIPLPRHLRGIIYGLTLLTGFDGLAILLGGGRVFHADYDRMASWVGSLIIYCKYMSAPLADPYERNSQGRSMLTMNTDLLELDRKIFYGFMVKTRLYNPITETHYYRFCSGRSYGADFKDKTTEEHIQRLYAQHRFTWAEPCYRFVDRLLLGARRAPAAAYPIPPNKAEDLPAQPAFSPVAQELTFSGGALVAQGPERGSPQI